MPSATEARTGTHLPAARGPMSSAVLDALPRAAGAPLPAGTDLAGADPFGEDLQLALQACYELHYQGFAGVAPEWEWDPELLRLRAAMERAFLDGLRSQLPGGDDVASALDELLAEPADGDGLPHYLRDHAGWDQLREYFAHRSIYHLKEADPHAWVIPRLRGRAKAALVAVEFDEFGGGRAERVHAQLFADLLDAAGLSSGYLHYLDHAPACTLATVNLMSMFGLHRALRGALVGHFAAAEISTPPSAMRIEQALRRLDAPAACSLFYTEHIEADAVHEQVMRHDVLGDVLEHEPGLASDIVLGIEATELLESRAAEHIRSAWREGRTSLRHPLPAPA